MADQRVPTNPQRVRVFLRGGILAEGNAHVKAGAYRQRVSDLLNLQSAPFLPLTDVRYQAPGTPATHTEAFLVHIPDIVAVDLGEDQQSRSEHHTIVNEKGQQVDISSPLSSPGNGDGASMPPPPPGSSL